VQIWYLLFLDMFSVCPECRRTNVDLILRWDESLPSKFISGGQASLSGVIWTHHLRIPVPGLAVATYKSKSSSISHVTSWLQHEPICF
jgi:hypothetical protein